MKYTSCSRLTRSERTRPITLEPSTKHFGILTSFSQGIKEYLHRFFLCPPSSELCATDPNPTYPVDKQQRTTLKFSSSTRCFLNDATSKNDLSPFCILTMPSMDGHLTGIHDEYSGTAISYRHIKSAVGSSDRVIVQSLVSSAGMPVHVV